MQESREHSANHIDKTAHSGSADQSSIEMIGGPWTALVPAAIFVGVLLWLSLTQRASISGFWVGGWAAIVAGVLLTRTKTEFAEAIVRGLSNKTGMVVIVAFIFAGVFGQILANSGLVNGLLWLGLETGVTHAAFVCLAFVLTCLFATGVGTSVGTYLAVLPILYPTGISLGADPAMLAVAILAGGSFGDNIAPISDTTISSAYTSGAEMGDVVRTRLPLTLAAAAASLMIFAVFGGGGQISQSQFSQALGPAGLVMIIPFVVVVALAIRRHHIIVALIWGSISAMAIGLIAGLITPSDIFAIPAKRGDSTGLIENGISGVSGAIVFVLFILALAQILDESGILQRILARLEAFAAKGVKGAEFAIAGITLLFTVPLGANAPAILLVGPTIGRPLGERHRLAAARIANLMDCSACTAFYILPWHNAVIIWFATLAATCTKYGLQTPALTVSFLNPYAWMLIITLIVSIATGWNRKYAG